MQNMPESQKKKKKSVTGIYLREHQQETCDTLRQPSQNCLVCVSHPPLSSKSIMVSI